jgi:heme-degrading monooxygenase HmoA
MLLEVAILNAVPGQTSNFERAFEQAQKIIHSMVGYVSHELQRCIEVPDQYALLVHWETIEDHEVGFRQSPDSCDLALQHVYT